MFGLQAKKSLGQHFLNSKHVLDQIIQAAKIEPGDRILEIGPGTGVLTKALLDAGAQVNAVEKDDRAYELLKEKFTAEISEKRLELIHGDILKEELMKDAAPFKLVANIPYYITGAILEKFLEHGPRPGLMVLLVQKEVAERILARDKKESILSISVKAFGEPQIIAKVPRGAFTPPPKVESAILSIEQISDSKFQGLDMKAEDFFKIVHAGFAHKRKYAIRNLENVAFRDNLNIIFNHLSLDPKIRPEDIPATSWLTLSSLILKD